MPPGKDKSIHMCIQVLYCVSVLTQTGVNLPSTGTGTIQSNRLSARGESEEVREEKAGRMEG